MKKEKLLICDHDPYYLEHLTDYLNRQPDFPWEVIPFTRTDALLEYQEKGRNWPVLMDESMTDPVNEPVASRAGQEASGTRTDVIYLREDEGVGGICRYQSCEDLKRCILECLQRRNPGDHEDFRELSAVREGRTERPDNCAWYGIYSPVNRCGKTIFAVTLGMILAEHRSVLYVNMENYHGLDNAIGREGRNDLADLIYQYRMEGRSGVEKILGNTLTQWGRLDCLNPAFSAYDLNDVDIQEWLQLLEQIITEGDYKAVVLDVGSQIREVFSLLKECDLLFVPVLNDRISKGKLQQFEENLTAMQMQTVTDRIRKVVVPRLRNDGELTGFPEQLPRGRIGSYVRQIVETEHLIESGMQNEAEWKK